MLTCPIIEVTCEIRARSSPPHQAIGTIAPDTINVQQGDWGVLDMCPNGTYAQGFSLKLEEDQAGGDNSALNAVQLICRYVHCLFQNRYVSVLHTLFTTLTEQSFSRKTLPCLGSGISSGSRASCQDSPIKVFQKVDLDPKLA